MQRPDEVPPHWELQMDNLCFLNGLIPRESCCLLGSLVVLRDVWQAPLQAGCREPSPRGAMPIKGCQCSAGWTGSAALVAALSIICNLNTFAKNALPLGSSSEDA